MCFLLLDYPDVQLQHILTVDNHHGRDLWRCGQWGGSDVALDAVVGKLAEA